SGRSKGFGFVEMTDRDAGMQAIEALNGSDMDGRNITVNEARPRERNNNRGGFGSRY
ncbi:MAG TPA: RNA-binding protein, partial [Guyparkeria sp.]|nr:RNA-binding protein [Guyparkeria sp.]